MTKQDFREEVWGMLEEKGVGRFPFPLYGRIPNFAGADEAADRLAAVDFWGSADEIKVNPDYAQQPVREHALRAGKVVFMAVPRLESEKCFLRLDPAAISDIQKATTIQGSQEQGEQVSPSAMPAIDLIVSGSVAVSENGHRIGKGEGYSDLEFAVLGEFGLVDGDTTTATTVHEIQILDSKLPTSSHDVPMDYIATPERCFRAGNGGRKPTSIDWDLLDAKKQNRIAVLDQLKDSY